MTTRVAYSCRPEPAGPVLELDYAARVLERDEIEKPRPGPEVEKRVDGLAPGVERGHAARIHQGRAIARHHQGWTPTKVSTMSTPEIEGRLASLGITPEPRADHASYIANWLTVLKNDKRAIFTAAAHAERAAGFLHGLQPKTEAANTEEQEAA